MEPGPGLGSSLDTAVAFRADAFGASYADDRLGCGFRTDCHGPSYKLFSVHALLARFGAILACIDRDLGEGSKLWRESEKLIAEKDKLMNEVAKHDRWCPRWLVIAGLIGGVVADITLILIALGRV